MNAKRKNIVAWICIFVVIILSAFYLFTSWAGGYNWVAWTLVILNLIAGPAALIAYLREVRKGVFKDSDNDAQEK